MRPSKQICSISLLVMGLMNPALAKKNEELETCKNNCKCSDEKSRRVVKKKRIVLH